MKPNPKTYPYAELEWVNPAMPFEKKIFVKRWIRGITKEEGEIIWVGKTEEMERIAKAIETKTKIF